MSVQIRIPTPLRRFTTEQAAVDVPGSTVLEALENLFTLYPGLKSQIVDENGQVRRFVNIYVNGDDIRFLDGPKTVLIAGDQLAIVPAIAGGSEPLTHQEIARYSRHLLLPEVAVEGQKKLRDGQVLLVGAGGLGSPAALYLAAAGVGTIGIVEFDLVDESNLQRQIVHDTTWVGKSKLESVTARLKALNPLVKVVPFEERLTSENALRIFDGFDIVVDGTDNFATRYLTNDACYMLKKPNVYGSIFRFEGQASVFWPDKGPCYRCLYPTPPPPGLVPSCAEGGVLGVLPGVIGCLQATEAIKILLGKGRPLVGRLLLYDALDLSFRELKLRKDPDCPLCGANRTVTGLVDYEEFCGIGRGEDAALPEGQEIGVSELKEWLDRGDDIQLLDVREPHEVAICAIAGARLVPLANLPELIHTLDTAKTTVVHCKMGARSAKAVQLLRQAGLSRTYNLRGGIVAWAREIDPSLATY
jgi:adenylyltransferase/sulfurtransferase